MTGSTIQTPAEYALYWLAVHHSEVLEAGWGMGKHEQMIANDSLARQEVTDILEDHIDRTLGRKVLDQADSR